MKNGKGYVKLETICKNTLGITTRWYRLLAKDKHVPAPVNGKVPELEACKCLITYYRKLNKGQGSLTLVDARTKLITIQAEQKALELERYRGELLHVETAMRLWSKVTISVDQKLSAVPVKLAPLIAGLTIPKAKGVIEKFIRDIRSELANPNLREVDRVSDDSEPGKVDRVDGGKANLAAAKTPTKTKRKRVGRQKKSN